jgi:hypothetical protein
MGKKYAKVVKTKQALELALQNNKWKFNVTSFHLIVSLMFM